MSDKNNENKWSQWKNLGIPFGLMLGTAVGVMVGTYAQRILWIPISAIMGLSLGIRFNSFIDRKCKEEEEKKK